MALHEMSEQQESTPPRGFKKFFRRGGSSKEGSSLSASRNQRANKRRGRGSASSKKEQSTAPSSSAAKKGSSADKTASNHNGNDEKSKLLLEKQLIKERDGFCRRVDAYDGNIISVEGKPAYELGNYLGGGVAGVVYEGHRLRPLEDYPVRLGANDRLVPPVPTVSITDAPSFLACGPNTPHVEPDEIRVGNRDPSLLTEVSMTDEVRTQRPVTEDMALEATEFQDQVVMIDAVDAPNRSKHYAKAISQNSLEQFPDDASITYGIMEETVAIKILNPVGFRTVDPSILEDVVVARKGDAITAEIANGRHPMEERHVYWVINPNSRNLRTLQRYSVDKPSRIEVDRGSADKGLRISLIAAYMDPSTNSLKELPLTRCIEIWGHVPFSASDAEFSHLMTSIDRIHQGLEPMALDVPGRVPTASTFSEEASLESLKISAPMHSQRTGIYRAASTARTTVFCSDLQAHIALPPVPSKYLKWLRQRRAATKEIRNMMLIGRHRNVVHLFEVLEHIEHNKSTMFLILELVRGGELFDLISSNSAKLSSKDTIPQGFTESETVMRKFFRELASGVNYCHKNGIAHRDLKPENLLVHNSRNGDCVLKIADFGLSAVFGQMEDAETVVESLAPNILVDGAEAPSSPATVNKETALKSSPSVKHRVDQVLSIGASLFTCGAVEDIVVCGPTMHQEEDTAPSPLKRMTSVVGSPHYVAPEIISQNEFKKAKKNGEVPIQGTPGYDGTRADVWSAGVILYAMLFRSLPFGEDLLRCPRFQSYKKWYEDVKTKGGRRSSAMGMLHPQITESDKQNMLGPHWFFPSETSPESRDLVVAMLNPDPNRRPTIQMVLQHPWLHK